MSLQRSSGSETLFRVFAAATLAGTNVSCSTRIGGVGFNRDGYVHLGDSVSMQSTTGLETRINIESASGSVKELRRFGANFYLDFTIDNLPDYDSSETSKAQRYRIKATSGQDERIVSIGVIGDRSIKIAPGRVKSQLGGGPEAPVVEEPQHTSETAPRMFAEIIAARWFLSEPKITEQDWQSNYGTGTQGFRITGAFPRFAGISGDRYETPEAIILVVTKSYPSKIVFYDVEVASGSGETEPVGL